MEQVFATIVDHESFGNYGVLIIVIGGYTQTRPGRLSNLSEKFRRLNIHHQELGGRSDRFPVSTIEGCSVLLQHPTVKLQF